VAIRTFIRISSFLKIQPYLVFNFSQFIGILKSSFYDANFS
jgi:hypothetical protein